MITDMHVNYMLHDVCKKLKLVFSCAVFGNVNAKVADISNNLLGLAIGDQSKPQKINFYQAAMHNNTGNMLHGKSDYP